MRCPNCGEELEAGNIFCKKCGQEQQIVPDYDPLDELILDHTEPHKKVKEKERKEDNRKQEKQTVHRKNPSTVQRVALLMLFILLGFGVFLASYFSISREKSYSYQLKKGMALADREEYEKAFPYLKKAYELQSESEGSDTRPLRYMAKTYAAMGAKQLAVECMDEAVNMEANAREDNYELEEIYLELMDILNETGQTELIQEEIDSCKYEKIKNVLKPYRIEKPSCDTPEGTYSYYVSIELDAKYGSIYYTLDGTEPTAESTRYEKPIELAEGETLLSAVAINKKGMISGKLVLVYKLEFKDYSMEEEEREW